MIGTISAIFLVYFYFFLKKSESSITTTIIRNEKYPLIDLKSKEQILMLEHYPEGVDYSQVLVLQTYLVTQNKKTG